MKTMRSIGCWAACMLVAAPLAAQGEEREVHEDGLPPITGARVTIPYGELKALWEAAAARRSSEDEPEPSEPPVDAVVSVAEYDLLFEEGKAAMDVVYEVRSFTEDWQLVPLVGGDPRLESAEADGADVVWRDDCYSLLIRGEGEFAARLRFAVPGAEKWEAEKGLRLVPGPAALNRLRIRGIPEGKAIRAQGVEPTEAAPGFAVYHLAGEACEWNLSLVNYRAPEPPGAEEPPAPSTWGIHSEVFVGYREGRLRYDARVYCLADDGSGLSMDLLLPKNVSAVRVSGEDVAEGTLGKREDGWRTLHVEWNTRDVLDRKLELSYELAQSPLASSWTLQGPRVAGGGEPRCFFAMPSVEGLELAGDDLKGAVESRRLPEWMREKIGQSDFLTAEAGGEYVMTTTWMPTVQTAQATIGMAEYETRLVGDGSMLVHAGYLVRHQAPMSWRLTLPDVDDILTCAVNEKPVKPVKRGESEIEFILPAPSSEEATTVTFCYASRLEALDPVSGRIDLELPSTDLFIHELKWALTIPDGYQAAEIEGNIEIDRSQAKAGAKGSEQLIRLKKELVRDEHPAVEIYYQKRGIDEHDAGDAGN